jgi:hypothetical protein
MRLVEAGTDEPSRVRKRPFDLSPQVSHLPCEVGGRNVSSRLRNDLPRCLGSLERNQRDLRGPVPVILHRIVIDIVGVITRVATVERPREFRT